MTGHNLTEMTKYNKYSIAEHPTKFVDSECAEDLWLDGLIIQIFDCTRKARFSDSDFHNPHTLPIVHNGVSNVVLRFVGEIARFVPVFLNKVLA
ncbi:hypothetical protein A0J61_06447 [Choanephora cucurbitarum]|uniref:Uncharacterized protein n=1 Tax=Choanephora cucurbitarum TaxID=101091 RepID=A0A1C7N8T8_9FUNG|nr:hypothetical protein A0J61_06447 [Choanephora cucurbitarum]